MEPLKWGKSGNRTPEVGFSLVLFSVFFGILNLIGWILYFHHTASSTIIAQSFSNGCALTTYTDSTSIEYRLIQETPKRKKINGGQN